MVAPSHRRQHLAQRLVVCVQQRAAQLGFGTITLDTRADDPSNLFYRSLGYTLAGEIPQYARNASGGLHTTAFYYKLLGASAAETLPTS